jgi:hypothetical protein
MLLTEYLELCVVEQTGDHTLGIKSKTPTPLTEEELKFLYKVLSFIPPKFGVLFPKEPAFVHITRDCQVIETGNHIARYTVIDCLGRSISFSMTFRQKPGEFPTTRSNMYVSFYENDDSVWRETLPNHHPSLNFFPTPSKSASTIEPKLEPDACIIS